MTELEHNYHAHAEISEPPHDCPHCNHHKIVGFGRRDELIIDTPMDGKRTDIMLNRRRYRCQSCRKTFLEPVPHTDDKRQMTNRLIQYIEHESLIRTFTDVAEEVGVDEKTVRNIFNDYCERLEKTLKFEMPQWLGIHETHIIQPRCVITNIKRQTIVDILDNGNQTTVRGYLSKHSDRDQIRYVTMNMFQPYRDAVATMIPNATVIIDKSHVVRMANESLERASKAIRNGLTAQQRRGLMRDRFVLLKRRSELTDTEYKRLSGWNLHYPEIGHAYELKESFFQIWDCKTRHLAQEAYYAWLRQITPEMKAHFDPLIETVSNWHDDIFAYFDHPITKTYTKNLNNLTHVMHSAGRGYSFGALRAKILFTENFHKIKKSRYQCEQVPNDVVDMSLPTNYGASIATLVRAIEAGRL